MLKYPIFRPGQYLTSTLSLKKYVPKVYTQATLKNRYYSNTSIHQNYPSSNSVGLLNNENNIKNNQCVNGELTGDLLYFDVDEKPPTPSYQTLPLDISVALVAPQQSQNVGSVARHMALYGCKQLFISPNDGGIDSMKSGYAILDIFDKPDPVTSLSFAPLLSPLSGISPKAENDHLLHRLTDIYDKSSQIMKSEGYHGSQSKCLIRPNVDLPLILRLSELQDVTVNPISSLPSLQQPYLYNESPVDLSSLLMPHVPHLLSFIDPSCFDFPGISPSSTPSIPSHLRITPQDVSISFCDRKRTLTYGKLIDICSIYSHIHIDINAAKLNALVNHAYLLLNSTSPLPTSSPSSSSTFTFVFTFMRSGRPSFKGEKAAQWDHQDVVSMHDTISEALIPNVDSNNILDEVLKSTKNLDLNNNLNNIQNTINSRKNQPNTSQSDSDVFSSMPLARLHPGIAITTPSYYTATKKGSPLLRDARLFNQLEDLLPHFDLIIGTSALFKPIKHTAKLPPGDDASSIVLRPWELSDLLVKTVVEHERNHFAYNHHDNPNPDSDNTTCENNSSLLSTSSNETSSPLNIKSPLISAPPLRVLVVMGRETSGLTATELDLVDALLTIPGPGPIGNTLTSLNLATACSTVLYELSRTQQLIKRYWEHINRHTNMYPQSPESYCVTKYGKVSLPTDTIQDPQSQNDDNKVYPPENIINYVNDYIPASQLVHKLLQTKTEVKEKENNPSEININQLQHTIDLQQQQLNTIMTEKHDLQSQLAALTSELNIYKSKLQNIHTTHPDLITEQNNTSTSIEPNPITAHDLAHLPTPQMRGRLWQIFSQYLQYVDPRFITNLHPSAEDMQAHAAQLWLSTTSKNNDQTKLTSTLTNSPILTDSSETDIVDDQLLDDSNRPLKVKTTPKSEKHPPATNSSYTVDYGLLLRKLVLNNQYDKVDMVNLINMFNVISKQMKTYRDALGISNNDSKSTDFKQVMKDINQLTKNKSNRQP